MRLLVKCGMSRGALLTLLALLAAAPGFGEERKPGEPSAAEYGRNYDLRLTLPARPAPEATAEQAAAVERLRAAVPDLRFELDDITGAARTISNAVGYLTSERRGGSAESIAIDFAIEELDLLGLTFEDLADYEVTDSVYSQGSGVTHLYLRQRHAGIPVYNGQLHVNVGADGRILSLNNRFVPQLALALNTTDAAIGAPKALQAALDHLRATPAEARSEPVLAILPIRPGEARLVWNFQLETRDQEHYYDITVDAVDARVWTRFDWVAEDQYRVYQVPVEAPTFTTPVPPADARTVHVNPADPTASPFGWHDTDGAAGAEFTIHRGNNAHAWEDSDANELPPAVEPDCGATLNCDFPLDLTMAPSAYRPAAVTNLFYWNNVLHDVLSLYGFDSPGGNFQVNTYGAGGVGGDDVRALAQSGAGTNNANFLTLPDGQRPRMRMYIWTTAVPNLDGDLDAGIITHEYGHGTSNRLVGGPANVSCMGVSEQPGEGVSDYHSLFFTFDAASPQAIRGIGTYALNEPTNGLGIRTQRYDSDIEPNTNTWTYGSLPGSAIPHGVGEKWAQAAWYAQGRLEDEHGFNPDIYNYTGSLGGPTDAGNIRAWFYTIEGMKNTVCGPGFVDFRDGIIAAATSSYGGQDVCTLWQAFADYGLGFSASQGSASSINDQTPAFDIPPSCSGVAAGVDEAICAGDTLVKTIGVGAAFTPPVTMSTSGVPAPATSGFAPNPVVVVPGSTDLTISNTAGVAAGIYPIEIIGTDGVPTVISDFFDLQVFAGVPGISTLISPVNSTSGHPLRPEFQWSAVAGTVDYLLEVDDDADFSSPVYSTTVTGTTHTATTDLPASTLLYWRVRAMNPCGAGTYSAIFRFATGSPGEVCSGGPIAIPGTSTSGPASPYPSTVSVSGVSAPVPTVTVGLKGLSHTWPDDIDMLLVGPGGQSLIVMSDVGGSADAVSLDITLDDAAPTLLPDSGPLATGSYRPSNVGANDPFDPPAPAGPYGNAAPGGADTLTSVFGGLSPNGTWSLYIDDDAGGDSGSMTEWCIGYDNPDAMPFIDGFNDGTTDAWGLNP